MLKVILFGYAHGLISSRRIAKACETNVLFMSASGDIQPHYTSIAGFVAKMHEQIEPLFTQVLMISDDEDLIGRNMLAINGWHFILIPSKTPIKTTPSLLFILYVKWK
ncbi:transposase [Pseudoalteromonas sp. NEC-BIFX-2020_015]|uniref:transposase n=1 Tax=Pseudoalteromonas sp. NEC-BIFX-2020_015 TaxID=2729544 RepID=UPI002010E961|nr:transposase [Pseudoalteromonas sp. NEC-BIFX-2020_015]